MKIEDIISVIENGVIDFLEDEDFDIKYFTDENLNGDGIIIKFSNGDEFQISTKQSKFANSKRGEE